MDVVICSPVRTPVGRMGGALAALSAAELATLTLRELMARTGLGDVVDDVILGNGYARRANKDCGRQQERQPETSERAHRDSPTQRAGLAGIAVGHSATA